MLLVIYKSQAAVLYPTDVQYNYVATCIQKKTLITVNQFPPQ